MTLADLLVKLDSRIGTAVTTRFTTAKKKEALNTARFRILMQYDIEEFIKESTVAFTSGVGTLPTDYLRIPLEGKRSLWNSTTLAEYQRVTIDRFDDDIDKTWTVKEGSAQIYTADTVTLAIRYTYNPTDMSDDSDDSGFSPLLDEAHVLKAVSILLFDDRQYDIAAAMEQNANRMLSNNISRQKQEYGQQTSSSLENAFQSSRISRRSIIL